MKILAKSNPAGVISAKDFTQTDVYTLNGGFKHNMYKIRVPIAHAKENKLAEKAGVSRETFITTIKSAFTEQVGESETPERPGGRGL